MPCSTAARKIQHRKGNGVIRSALAPLGAGMMVLGQVAPPDTSTWIQGGGLVILGYLCYSMIQRDIKRDDVLLRLGDAITALRVHCATKVGEGELSENGHNKS